jgi:hypothetical protein
MEIHENVLCQVKDVLFRTRTTLIYKALNIMGDMGYGV